MEDRAVELGNQLGALCSVQLCCLVADVNDNTLGGNQGFQTDNFFPRRLVDAAGRRDSE